ncbi:MAG: hypothetical protein A2622_00315 [Bdellovibrionales bacterium RIFCSPHIGHO2_01_FULL_40_29]|nr:MAG: hypothetical protein A2622_00315 [Bdellovibrionales bacterium RIFCSPHIGHO2_01_FULL_40_29]
MKIVIIILLVIFSYQSVFAESIYGEWKFEEMIYRNERIPRADPALNLRWIFFENGTERLYWDRGTADFCERFATFVFEKGMLQEKVFALNPRNGMSCSQDPDMQPNGVASTPAELVQDELWLHLLVGDEELIYILRKPKP